MNPRGVDGYWVKEWMDAGWAGDRVRQWQWQWILGVWSVNFFLPVGSPWRGDLWCALDVGRELSKLHGAEANSILSRRRYPFLCWLLSSINNSFFLLHICVNKLSGKYATTASFLLTQYCTMRFSIESDTLSVLPFLQHSAPITIHLFLVNSIDNKLSSCRYVIGGCQRTAMLSRSDQTCVFRGFRQGTNLI